MEREPRKDENRRREDKRNHKPRYGAMRTSSHLVKYANYFAEKERSRSPPRRDRKDDRRRDRSPPNNPARGPKARTDREREPVRGREPTNGAPSRKNGDRPPREPLENQPNKPISKRAEKRRASKPDVKMEDELGDTAEDSEMMRVMGFFSSFRTFAAN